MGGCRVNVLRACTQYNLGTAYCAGCDMLVVNPC